MESSEVNYCEGAMRYTIYAGTSIVMQQLNAKVEINIALFLEEISVPAQDLVKWVCSVHFNDA
jgi:hypothetical protein